MDGSKKELLESLATSLVTNSKETLTPNQKFLRSVSARWARSARANCGTQYIAQWNKNLSLRGPE